MTSEFLIIAEKLMEIELRPMRPKEIVDLAYKKKLFSDNIAGKTPHQTMKAKLSVHVRREGANSKFIRTSPGHFYLRRLLENSSNIFYAKPITPPPPNEHVLTFPVTWIDKMGRFQGIRTSWKNIFSKLMKSKLLKYMDRRDAELDDTKKQIITYVMITKGEKVLAFRRGNYNRAEEFLRGAHCIGFGGHVVTSDFNLFHKNDYGIHYSAARELVEELKLPEIDKQRIFNDKELKIVGLLNDDSSKNGQRHFAILFSYEVSDDQAWNTPIRNEKSITQLRWIDPNLSPQSLWDFEYWSQLCLLKFYQKGKITEPTYVIRRKRPFTLPNIIIVLGPLGSGKSETTHILKTEFAYQEINSGKVLANQLSLPPVSENTRESFQNVAFSFINSKNGTIKLADAIYKEISESSSDRILIEGIRQRKTLEILKELLKGKNIGVIFVHTPAHIAFDFYMQRSGKRKEIYDFLRVRSHPVEQEADGMISVADIVLYNWKGRNHYRLLINNLMRELGIKKRKSK